MSKQLKPESKCPECKGKLSWKVVHGEFGKPSYNGLCKKCNIILKNRETPEVSAGRKLALSGELDGVHCMDKRITSLSCDTQIGFLRQLMHPKGNEVYSPFCTKCNGPKMQYEQKDGSYICSKCKTKNT